MKALSIQEPGRSRLIDIADPKPGPGELLLQTRIIGLCGTDLSTFRGKNPLVSYPRIPGHEIAATILEVGAGVPDYFKTGMDVTAYPNTSCGTCAACRRGRGNACKYNETLGVQRDGALKEFFTIGWEKLVSANSLSLRELSLVEPLSVGFHAVERARVIASDAVAVIGCGMVGLGAIAAAAMKGADVIAIDVDDRKIALGKLAGARHSINSRTSSVHDELSRITSGFGPDAFIEAVGIPQTYRQAVEEVAHTGRVVYIGWAKEPVCYETREFVYKELDILGSRNYLGEFPAVISMLLDRNFPVDESISATVPLAQTGDALRRWSEFPEAFTKILVDLDA